MLTNHQRTPIPASHVETDAVLERLAVVVSQLEAAAAARVDVAGLERHSPNDGPQIVALDVDWRRGGVVHNLRGRVSLAVVVNIDRGVLAVVDRTVRFDPVPPL